MSTVTEEYLDLNILDEGEEAIMEVLDPDLFDVKNLIENGYVLKLLYDDMGSVDDSKSLHDVLLDEILGNADAEFPENIIASLLELNDSMEFVATIDDYLLDDEAYDDSDLMNDEMLNFYLSDN